MPYRSLSGDAIVETLERLQARVCERFPDRGIAKVACDLAALAQEETGRARRLSRPRYLLRLLTTLLIAAALSLIAYIVFNYALNLRVERDVSIFESVDAALNIALLTGAGIFFLATLESRMKRGAALDRINQLRSIAHVIDMHQLTKDPTIELHGEGVATVSSPPRDLAGYDLVRYLDYCAEMLALTGKLAAVYLEHVKDPVLITAVGELENLTSDLSRKVWMKISVLEASAAGQRAAEGLGVAPAEVIPIGPTETDPKENETDLIRTETDTGSTGSAIPQADAENPAEQGAERLPRWLL